MTDLPSQSHPPLGVAEAGEEFEADVLLTGEGAAVDLEDGRPPLEVRETELNLGDRRPGPLRGGGRVVVSDPLEL